MNIFWLIGKFMVMTVVGGPPEGTPLHRGVAQHRVLPSQHRARRRGRGAVPGLAKHLEGCLARRVSRVLRLPLRLPWAQYPLHHRRRKLRRMALLPLQQQRSRLVHVDAGC